MWTPLLPVDCCHGQRLGVGDRCWIILFKLDVTRNQESRSDLELLACFAFLGSGLGVGPGTVLRLPVAVIGRERLAWPQRWRRPARISPAGPGWCGSRLALAGRWPRWRGWDRYTRHGLGAWPRLAGWTRNGFPLGRTGFRG